MRWNTDDWRRSASWTRFPSSIENSTPSRSAYSETVSSLMPNALHTCSMTTAPPRRMSARAGSIPGSLRRSSGVATLASASTTSVICLRVTTVPLSDCGTGSSDAASAMATTASAVPELATATSCDRSPASRTVWASRSAT